MYTFSLLPQLNVDDAGNLVITGERKWSDEKKEPNFRRQERSSLPPLKIVFFLPPLHLYLHLHASILFLRLPVFTARSLAP